MLQDLKPTSWSWSRSLRFFIFRWRAVLHCWSLSSQKASSPGISLLCARHLTVNRCLDNANSHHSSHHSSHASLLHHLTSHQKPQVLYPASEAASSYTIQLHGIISAHLHNSSITSPYRSIYPLQTSIFHLSINRSHHKVKAILINHPETSRIILVSPKIHPQIAAELGYLGSVSDHPIRLTQSDQNTRHFIYFTRLSSSSTTTSHQPPSPTDDKRDFHSSINRGVITTI
ncbi:hypothetical protein BZA77DRAFT_307015 [Pyronema omphalodes]|nr:hypothetical protein BZA77DRAFT_307015 [Pyronema omphalodes]